MIVAAVPFLIGRIALIYRLRIQMQTACQFWFGAPERRNHGLSGDPERSPLGQRSIRPSKLCANLVQIETFVVYIGAFDGCVHRNRIGVFLHINDTLFPL